jgi:hypothetical protein
VGSGNPNSQISKPVMGRPSVMTDDKLVKLREAFLLGASDREAVLYADISLQTLYNYQKNNPNFIEQKQLWKETPTLTARNELVKGLKGNPELSLKYLERKRRKEFGPDKEEEGTGTHNQLNIFMGNNEQFVERFTRLLSGIDKGSTPGETQRHDSNSTPGSGDGADVGRSTSG